MLLLSFHIPRCSFVIPLYMESIGTAVNQKIARRGGEVRCSRKIHRLAILLTRAAGKIANKRPPPYFSAGIVNYKNCNNKQQSDTFIFMVELDEILIWCNLFKSFEWISLLRMLTVATSKCHNFFVYARRTF